MTFRKLTLALLSAAAVLAAFAGSAQAAKVANPGSVTFTFQTGALDIRDQHFDAASSDDPITASGTVNSAGAMTLNNFHFPPLDPIDGPLGAIDVSINVIGTPTGTINPLTGATNISLVVRIDADGTGLGGDCHVGNINLNLTTAGASGVPYNTANGAVTLVDHSFAVPGASGCSTFPINVNNEVNSQLGLPSPSGSNHGVLTATSTPILGKAIVPAFTATPSSGPAPLPVDFNASSTFHSRPVSNYQWDFTNDGSFDASGASPATSFTYANPGTYTARMRVTDADGDAQETTRQIVVAAAPDLTITKSHAGDFVSGSNGTYDIGVTNTGAQPATGTITVTDQLPGDMAFAGSSSAGWSCGAVGQLVTCTSDDDVASGASAAALAIDVTPGVGSVGVLTNTASVDVSGDANDSNDSASDPTRVLQAGIDASIVKSVDQSDGFFRGHRATYVLHVENAGTASGTDRIRVDDTLPAGVSFVGAAGGADWTCSFSAGTVHCFSDTDLAGGAALQDIRVRVDVASDAPSAVSNTATVSVNGDTNPANDSSTADATVEGFATDYALGASHDGDFVAGEPGVYQLSVANVGFATGGSDVTVIDVLPDGITYTGSEGDGWSCGVAGQQVTCTHAGDVEGGEGLPTLALQVDVGASAIGTATNEAAVSSPDDFNVANDVASDPTTVRSPEPDLAISKTHEGNFTAGANGTYTIAVTNLGTDPAHGPTTVTDNLPAGMTFVSGTGPGWSCEAAGPVVTCTHAAAIGGGESTSIELVVDNDRLVTGTSVNHATVANADDSGAGNNAADDPTAIGDPAPIVTKLVASPTLIAILDTDGSVLKGTYGLAATLKTADGTPVEGKTVTFSWRDANSPTLCTATTNADGYAQCALDGTRLLQVIAGLRWNARFGGDLDYAPSSDVAALLTVLGLKVP